MSSSPPWRGEHTSHRRSSRHLSHTDHAQNWYISFLNQESGYSIMRAVDLYIFNPNPTFQVNLDPDPIRIQGFDYQKLNLKNTAEHFLIFLWKFAIYLCPSYKRSLQPSKENIQHFKKWIHTEKYEPSYLFPHGQEWGNIYLKPPH